ncbi:MAG: cell division protein FtsZ [Christensenellales bacterium]
MYNEEENILSTSVAKIKVIGVGGGGCNAVQRMINYNFQGPEFIAVNTDKQALITNPATKRIQIGAKLTKGLGAGADPDIGQKAAEESKAQITEVLQGADLVFITAGMGGGTGTGAAAVVAQVAKELGILTIAVVTKPFPFEGKVRAANAEKGIANLKKYVDTLVIIPNEKLLKVMPKGTSFLDSFKYADEVLRQGIQGITDLIINPGVINLDFADVKTIMKNKGYAHMGIGIGKGENKVQDAVRNAVYSPLLETQIEGATGVLLNVKGGLDMALDEVNEASELVREVVDPSCNIIFGTSINHKMTDSVEVTIIATGFTGGKFADEKPEQKQDNVRAGYNQFFGGVNREPNIPSNLFGGQAEVYSKQTSQNVNYGYGQNQNNGYQQQNAYNHQQNGYAEPQRPAPTSDDKGRMFVDGSDIPPFLRKMKK